MTADDAPPGAEQPADDRDTHQVLMDATYRTLATAGYDDLSLRAVAEEAGKSRGLVHYHFDSKHDLVLSLLDYLLAGLEADLEPAASDAEPGEMAPSDPERALRDLLDRVGYGPRDGDPDAYYRALYAIRGRAPFDDAIRERLTRNYRHVVGRCAAIIEAGIESGHFRPVDPETTATFLVVAVDGARNTDLSLATGDTRQGVFDAIDEVVVPALVATG